MINNYFTLLDFTQDFTDYGCIGIAILTHGSNSGLLRAKDEKYSEVEIINYFKVHDKPSLVTKPKFLIVQVIKFGFLYEKDSDFYIYI